MGAAEVRRSLAMLLFSSLLKESFELFLAHLKLSKTQSRLGGRAHDTAINLSEARPKLTLRRGTNTCRLSGEDAEDSNGQRRNIRFHTTSVSFRRSDSCACRRVARAPLTTRAPRERVAMSFVSCSVCSENPRTNGAASRTHFPGRTPPTWSPSKD